MCISTGHIQKKVPKAMKVFEFSKYFDKLFHFKRFVSAVLDPTKHQYKVSYTRI